MHQTIPQRFLTAALLTLAVALAACGASTPAPPVDNAPPVNLPEATVAAQEVPTAPLAESTAGEPTPDAATVAETDDEAPADPAPTVPNEATVNNIAPPTEPAVEPVAEPTEEPDWTQTASVEGDFYVFGNPAAPIRLVDFSDFL